ncbi:hypothetical protein RRG08_042515 [Elysia crispata]|uniref:Uncharacterized protein n=1 Tax=Elysia crispata TaxID=231223 RepID=A0AAE0XPZ6_9GAST|nr:hypothetical protein RRG08_042515 [Elysia crispata]
MHSSNSSKTLPLIISFPPQYPKAVCCWSCLTSKLFTYFCHLRAVWLLVLSDIKTVHILLPSQSCLLLVLSDIKTVHIVLPSQACLLLVLSDIKTVHKVLPSQGCLVAGLV